MAHNAVHVPVVHQRAGMAIVGAQDEIARIKALFGDRRDLAFDVIPRRPKPHHRPHPLAHARNRVGLAGAFVIVRRAARHIGVKRGP